MSKNMWKLVAFVLMLAGFATLWLTLKEGVPFPLSIFGAVACIFLEIAALATGIVKGSTNPGPRPLIFVWTRGLVTGAATEGDFTDAVGVDDFDPHDNIVTDRVREALKSRPEPRRMAYFTDDSETHERLGKNYAGSIDQLREFIDGYCRVARAEMLMRENPENAISFTELQNLSFGEVPDVCRMP